MECHDNNLLGFIKSEFSYYSFRSRFFKVELSYNKIYLIAKD